MVSRFNLSTFNASTVIIQRSPEVPGCNRAIRPPLLAMLHQLFRCGKFTFAKSFRETLLHPIVGDRPDIRPTKIKQQKHLDSPATDTAHLRKTRDDFVIAHSQKGASGWHGAVERFCREIFYCRSLRARKTSGAKFFIRCGKNFSGV